MTMISALRAQSARRISTFCCSAVRSPPAGAPAGQLEARASRRAPRRPSGERPPRRRSRTGAAPRPATRSRRPSAAGRWTAPGRSRRRRARAPRVATGTRSAAPSRSIRPSSADECARDDAAERRLARAVLADERVHAAAGDGERDAHRAPGRPRSAWRRSGARGAPRRSCAHRRSGALLAGPLRLELRGVRPA